MLTDRSVKLLFAQGHLNVRGVIEWLAEDNSSKPLAQIQTGAKFGKLYLQIQFTKIWSVAWSEQQASRSRKTRSFTLT